MTSSSLTALRLVMRAFLIALTWVRGRVFIATPRTWSYALAGALLASIATLLGAVFLGLAFATFGVSLLVSAVLAVPVWKWRSLRRPSARAKVVLARFRSENPAYEELATVHVRQIERRLRRQELLRHSFEIRVETIPLDETQSRRLLEESDAVAVISGSGLTVADHARWEGWAILRWPALTGRKIWNEETGVAREVDAEAWVSRPEHHVMKPDPEQPLSTLTADVLPASHAAAIEAALLLLAAEWSSDEPRPYVEAAARAPDLPLATRARLEVAQVALKYREQGDPVAAARELEAAGNAGCDHIALWSWCQSYVMAAFPDGANSADLLRVALRGVQADPDDSMSNANVAFSLRNLGRLEEARAYFERALGLAAPDEPSNLHPALVANLFFAGGGEEEWHRWRRHFATMRPLHREGVMRQLELDEGDIEATTPPAHFGRLLTGE